MRCLVILLVVSGAAVGQNAHERTAESQKGTHAPAVAKGRAEADIELATGNASIWTFGQIPLFSDSLDRETGLYFSSLGCVIDDEIVGRVDGHNARIAEYVRGHGLPKNLFKPWEKELFGLKDYFESRRSAEKPIHLTIGGLAAVSPRGEYAVKLVEHADRTLDGRPTESTWIVVGDQDMESKRCSLLMGNDAELLWGPKGSWFAVLKGRSRTSDEQKYMALDLRQVGELRLEFGKPQPAFGDAGAPKDPYDFP